MSGFCRCKSDGALNEEKQVVDFREPKGSFIKLVEWADDEELPVVYDSNFRTRSAPVCLQFGGVLQVSHQYATKHEERGASLKGRSEHNFHVGLLHVCERKECEKKMSNGISRRNQTFDSEVADFLSLFGRENASV